MSSARGTVVKRGNRYSVVVDVGRDENGRRIRKWHSGFLTKGDAEKARTQILSELDRGSYIQRSDVSVASFAEFTWFPFLDSLAEGRILKKSTTSSYVRLTSVYVLPEIGHLPLASLKTTHLNSMYVKLLASGRKRIGTHNSASLSATTVGLIHRTVHRMLGDAVSWDSLPKNVADKATPPRNSSFDQQTPKSWSPDELKKFIAATRDDRLGPIWLLFCTTGLRRGEVAGLRWSDVDLDGGSIRISRANTVVDHQVVTSSPKTPQSQRTLGVDGETLKALKALRATQARERLAWGAAYGSTDLLVVREDGSPVHPAIITKMFNRITNREGLPKIRLHGLRHSHASAALEAGVPMKVVSNRLGHSSIRVTGDIYSHVRPEVDRSAAELIAETILR